MYSDCFEANTYRIYICITSNSCFFFHFQESGVRNYSTILPLKTNVTSIQAVNNALARFYSKSKSTKHHREYISDSDSDSDSDDERPKSKLTVSYRN